MARRSRDASDVIDSFVPLARIYNQDFINRHMILEFNGMELDIHWKKKHFMHLCGLECTVPQRMYRSGKVSKPEAFFDALLSGKATEFLPVHAHNSGITDDKLNAMKLMLDSPDSIDMVTESASNDYDYFFGSDLWCAGVKAVPEDEPIDPDAEVHAPRTLRKVSIMSRSIRIDGKPAYPLDGCRIVPPRATRVG